MESYLAYSLRFAHDRVPPPSPISLDSKVDLQGDSSAEILAPSAILDSITMSTFSNNLGKTWVHHYQVQARLYAVR